MTDITYQIEHYINSQNREIWNKIRTEYLWELKYDPYSFSWMARSENGIATIITPTKKIEYDSFSHEMLHIYLDYLGLSKIDDVFIAIQDKSSYKLFIENNLLAYIYNFCSHKKMYQYYHEMGFSDKRFVMARISLNTFYILRMKRKFNSRNGKKQAINQIIGQSISLMNNVVQADQAKCNKYLKMIGKINPELFNIINEFDKNWTESQNLNFTPIFINFVDELESWLNNNNINYSW